MIKQSSKNKQSCNTTVNVESIVGVIIFLSLCAIGLWIYLKQFEYDRSSFNITTVQKEEIKAVKKDEPPLTVNLTGITPANFNPLSSIETFDKNTLSNKIDGRADLYLESGFVQLFTQRFVSTNNSNEWFELFVYDMENMRNASSVYSVQIRSGVTTSDLTPFAYVTENALFFVQGKYYIEIIAAQPSKILSEAILECGRNFIAKNPQKSESFPELAFFPSENMKKGSIKIFVKNAFSFDKFGTVAAAEYTTAGKDVLAFVSICENAPKAASLAQQYYDFLISLGGEDVKVINNKIPDIKMINMIGDYEIVFAYSKVAAGIHAAKDKAAAEIIANNLYKKITEVEK